MAEDTKRKLNFIINTFYIVLVCGIVYGVFKYLIRLIFPFLAAFALVTLLHPLIVFANKKIKIRKDILYITVLLILYITIGWSIFWIITKLVFLIRDLFTVLPLYFQSTVLPALSKLYEALTTFFGRHMDSLGLNLSIELEMVYSSLMGALQNVISAIPQLGVGLVAAFTNSIPSVVIALVFTISLSFFISLQYDAVVLFLKWQIPPNVQKLVTQLKSILKDTLIKYLRAYLILMMVTFLELTIGLTVLRTPNATSIAAGIALFDLLPVVGTGAIVIPWILIELFQQNISYALGLTALYAIVTAVRNIIEPKIVGDQLGLNPIVSLLSVYLGYQLFGVIGMITFPIVAQVFMALHQSGTVQLYKKGQ